jgi:hypothetical protein
MTLPEWQPALPAQPEWWDIPNLKTSQSEEPQPVSVSRKVSRRPAPPTAQNQLFDTPEMQISAASPTQGVDWIDAFLQSQVYASQRSLAARVAPPDEQMRKLLTVLAERGGKLSRAALAQRLAVPEIRLSGLLSAMRRILNVDQSTVLLVDETAGTVELNRTLLLQQFRITTTGGVR